MTRGNERDQDRIKAVARAKAAAGGSSTLKSADSNAAKLQLKQAASEARKEEERQLALEAAGAGSQTSSRPKEVDATELARREAGRLEREAAWIQKQVRVAPRP